MKQLIMSMSLTLFSLVSSAAGWIGDSTVENYYVSGSGNLHIRLTSGDVTTSVQVQSCSSRTYIYYSKTDSNFKEVFASVMAAKVSGGSMNFYVQGCKGETNNNTYPHGRGFTAS